MHDEAEAARRRGDARGAENILASVEPTWTGSVAYRALVPPTTPLVVHQCPTQVVRDFKFHLKLAETELCVVRREERGAFFAFILCPGHDLSNFAHRI